MNRPPRKKPADPAPRSAQESAYFDSISRLCFYARKWRTLHPDAQPAIQYNYPPNVRMICPIGVALEKGIITANAEGKAWIEAITAKTRDTPEEATIVMLQMATENYADAPPMRCCPACGYLSSAYSQMAKPGDKRAKPMSGDFVVCIGCAAINVFTDELDGLAPLTPEQEAALRADADVWKAICCAQEILRALHRRA